jgi:hypothetical protein
MKLVTHMPDDERRKPIDIEVCRTKVKESIFVPNLVKNPQTMFWLKSIKLLFYF